MTKKFLVPVVLPRDPQAPLEAATMQYVDGKLSGGGTDEVWVGPSEPADPNIELWYDSDAPAPSARTPVVAEATKLGVNTITNTASTGTALMQASLSVIAGRPVIICAFCALNATGGTGACNFGIRLSGITTRDPSQDGWYFYQSTVAAGGYVSAELTQWYTPVIQGTLTVSFVSWATATVTSKEANNARIWAYQL